MASPFTYEQMKANQKRLGPTGPWHPDAPVPDDPAYDTPALEPDSAATDTTATPTPDVPTPPPAPTPVSPATTSLSEDAAKRKLTLSIRRNGPEGAKLFADQLRREYKLKPSEKMSDHDVLQSAFELQAADEPNITPDTFMQDLHGAYGTAVDRALIAQAKRSYDLTDEKQVIDKMYTQHIKNEELPPITYEDMAQIVARKYPALHNSALEPPDALEAEYKLQHDAHKTSVSYNDWLHEQAAPTLWEKAQNIGAGFIRGLGDQLKNVGQLAGESTQAQLAASGAEGSGPQTTTDAQIVAMQPGTPEAAAAQQRLQEAAKGGVTLAATAAGPAVGAGLKAAEEIAPAVNAFGISAGETAPVAAHTLEAATMGGVQGGGEAAVEGKSPGEIGKAALVGAATAAPLGTIAGLHQGHVSAVTQKADYAAYEAEQAANREGALAAGREDAARLKATQDAHAQARADATTDLTPQPPAPPPPPPTDVLALASRAQAEQRWGTAVTQFAKEHNMDPSDVHALVDPETPDVANLAAAKSRHGVSIEDIDALKEMKPDHMQPQAQAPAEAPTSASLAPDAVGSTGTIGGLPGTVREINGDKLVVEGAQGERTVVDRNQFQPNPKPALSVVEGKGGEQPKPVEERLTEAIKGAQKTASEQAKLYRQERAQRVQAAEGARKAAGGGVAGAAAARAELVGEMPKAKFEAIKGVLTQDGVNELYDRLGKAGFSQWERISAEEALHRLLGLSPGGAPRPFEISLLKRAFGANMVEALSDRSLAKDIGHWLKVAVEMPRAIMTSHGFSVFFRQGFRAIGTPEYWTSIIPTIRAWGSEKFARSLDADIRSRPTYEVASKPVSQGGAGVHFNEMSEAGGEEGLASAQQLLERTPVAGKQFFARNGRAFVAGLNRMRIEMFDRVYKNVADSGRDVTDPKFLKALGELVNSQTGRGAMTKSAERASQLLAEWMFSPRLTVSRFDPFNPLYYGTKFNQGLMTETVRQNLSAAAAATAILGTFSAAGYKVGMDYRSADFGKARKGDTRVDPLGGHAQVIRLLGQIGSGQTVSSETGKVTNLRSGKFGAKTTLDVIGQFFANKEAPIPSLIVLGFRKLDNQLGPDGLPINMGKEALERMVPIPFGSVLQAAKEWHDDPAQLAQFGVLAQVGMGVETYKKELQGPAPIQFTKDGHTVRVSDRTMNAFLEDIKAADMHATARALALTATPSGKRNISDAGAEKLTKDLVKSERAKVLYRWNQANKDAQVKYDETGAGTVKYDRTPEEDLARRYKGNK